MEIINYFILILIFITIYFILFYTKKESFVNSINNNNIQCLILDNNDNNEIKENVHSYIGTFMKSKNNYDTENAKLLFNSYSLKSNNWTINDNNKLHINDKTIIIDLSYDKYKKLLAIGLHLDKGIPYYNIYSKVTSDLKLYVRTCS